MNAISIIGLLLLGAALGAILMSVFGTKLSAKIKADADKAKAELLLAVTTETSKIRTGVSSEASVIKSTLSSTESTLKSHITSAVNSIPNLNTPSKLP